MMEQMGRLLKNVEMESVAPGRMIHEKTRCTFGQAFRGGLARFSFGRGDGARRGVCRRGAGADGTAGAS
jgi:hypothetical protein